MVNRGKVVAGAAAGSVPAILTDQGTAFEARTRRNTRRPSRRR